MLGARDLELRLVGGTPGKLKDSSFDWAGPQRRSLEVGPGTRASVQGRMFASKPAMSSAKRRVFHFDHLLLPLLSPSMIMR